MPASPSSPTPDPLIGLRALVLLLIAVLIGLGTGALTFFGNGAGNAPLAVLAGLTAAGVSVATLHSLVGDA